MNLFTETVAWLTDPINWSGADGIPTRLLQHLWVTLVVTLISVAIAVPLGAWMGHTHRGQATIAAIANAARALPTLGLVTLFALWLGIGVQAPLIALVVLAIPTILAATYSGVSSVPAGPVDAAKSIGHTPMQTLTKVELPLALPVIGGAVQSALLQVVATATIAAYVSNIGLGRFIFRGLKSQDYPQMLAGSALVIALALVLTALGATLGIIYRRIIRHPGGTT